MPRPPGSTNKPKLISWRGTSKDPALFLARMLSDDDCSVTDRIRAAIALMPYVHPRLPTELDVSASIMIPSSINRVIIDHDSAAD